LIKAPNFEKGRKSPEEKKVGIKATQYDLHINVQINE